MAYLSAGTNVKPAPTKPTDTTAPVTTGSTTGMQPYNPTPTPTQPAPQQTPIGMLGGSSAPTPAPPAAPPQVDPLQQYLQQMAQFDRIENQRLRGSAELLGGRDKTFVLPSFMPQFSPFNYTPPSFSSPFGNPSYSPFQASENRFPIAFLGEGY